MFDRIGMRTVKTAISIFICLMIFLLLKTIEYIPGVEENIAFKWYNPFFAAIATAYSIYPGKKKSVQQAKNRCVASIIGGVVAILLVVLYEFITKNSWPTLTGSSILELLLPYSLIAVFSILVVVIGVELKQRPAIFVAILTFLSITVNANATISTTWGEWVFGINRILSTTIGVLVALSVNCFRLPRLNKNKDLLFCVGIEGIIAHDTDKIINYMNYQLNNVFSLGVNCSLFTTRTPATFMHLLDDVEINSPVICCSGAALFDTKRLVYINQEKIADDVVSKVDMIFDNLNVTPFKNYISNDVLHIYSKNVDNIGENKYIETMKNASYCICNFNDYNNEYGVLYYLLIEKSDRVNLIVDSLNSSEIGDKLFIQIYDYFDHLNNETDYKYIKVYSKEVEKLNVLRNYALANNLRIVGLTASKMSDHLLNISDYSITYKKNIDISKNDSTIVKSNYNKMFKQISKMYYSRKYSKQEGQVDQNE